LHECFEFTFLPNIHCSQAAIHTVPERAYTQSISSKSLGLSLVKSLNTTELAQLLDIKGAKNRKKKFPTP
ncbi:hypothetical protein, partial [Nostoc sp. 'Peltigera malacea cyanobiont' DB3992]|uniref:hypothetical protein n=1 Tax=Nostoc sp. 'Peltigera malacea cyanobiont' DB3992 TaxID=1206980 RepID=UPI0027B8BB12